MCINKPEKIKEKISIAADVCTIVGVVIAIVAGWYAYCQYDLYKRELQKTSDLNLRVSTVLSASPGISDFEFERETNWSKPKEISISFVNKGDATVREVILYLSFNSSIKVLNCIKLDRGFKHVVEGRQIFIFKNLNFPVPPDFPASPVAKLEVKIAAPSQEQKRIFGMCKIYAGEKDRKTLELTYDYKQQLFETKVVPDSKFNFQTGKMEGDLRLCK